MNKKTINIKGMHCKSCEILIEDELSKLYSVDKVNVNYHKQTADIYFNASYLNERQIENAVHRAGYELGIDERPWFSKNARDYKELGIAALVVVCLYLIARVFGLFNINFDKGGDYSSLFIVFLVGLTAGLSTCMALVGGLVLGTAAKFAEKHPNATSFGKFKPHLFFNAGRIFFFLIFGAIIGYFGSFFKFSTSSLGFFTILAGLAMLLMGLQVIGIFPGLDKLKFTFPKWVFNLVGIKNQNEAEYSGKGSFILGGLTFFLPCGFTQAMQIFAISTGSPITGALTMAVFALGTTPGLLGIGGLTSSIKGTNASLFFKSVGIAVILMSLYNISNGYNLTGIRITFPENTASTAIASDISVNNKGNKLEVLSGSTSKDVQVIKTVYTQDTDIQPNSFRVKKNIPVRFEVTANDSGYGCMGSFTIPGLTDRIESLRKGKVYNFEFTPTTAGVYQITCAMGVPRGEIIVS